MLLEVQGLCVIQYLFGKLRLELDLLRLQESWQKSYVVLHSQVSLHYWYLLLNQSQYQSSCFQNCQKFLARTWSSRRIFDQALALSDGKVRFSSVQRGISLNLEPNSRFGSRHFAEPWTGPTVQVQFWFEPVRTFGAWEKYFKPLFQSKSLENVNIYLIYLILDRGRLFCYDFCLTNGCWLSCELWVMVCGSSGTPF